MPLLAVTILACSPAPDTGAAPTAKPNIVLILIDDMGYNDLGANGNSKVTTPHLDRLAAEGVRFTRHYTDSTCTATRVGVLTGMDPAALGFRPDQVGISPEVQTLPELLKEAGYSTHHIGKWHAGFASRHAWPTEQGFDTFFGFLSQFLLRGPHENGKWKYGRPTYHNPWLQEQSAAPTQHQGHLSEILVQRVEGFLDSREESDTPWFVNFWMYAPHTPIQPQQYFAEQYPNTPEGRYYAFLQQLDATVGRVVASLSKNGLAENTLLLVASDNGGTNKQVDNNAPYFGNKATYHEGGVRTPLIIRWPGRFSGGEVFDGIVSNLDYLPTLVAAAGGQIPDGLKGRNLYETVIKPPADTEPLYWEMSNSEKHSWGILSANGKWRMSQYFFGEAVLNDLEKRPAGDENSLPDQKLIGDALLLQHRRWHNEKRIVHYDYERLQGNGRARLLGESLQRSPGFGGYTFLIEVTPEQYGSDTEESESQIIAFQENRWQLSRKGTRLILDVNGVVLEAQAPAEGRCSSIAVTSHFSASYMNPAKRRGLIELYINGSLSAHTRIERPGFPVDDYLNATYIGQDEKGESLYRGKLSRPIILNERLVTNEENISYLMNDIEPVVQGLCR